MRTIAALSLVPALALCLSAEAGRPKNGKYVERWPNGKVKLEGFYRDGIRDGYWTWFRKNGKVQARVRYIKARKHGLEENLSEFGEVLAKTEWRHGVRHGSHLEQAWATREGRRVMYSKTTGRYNLGRKDGEWVTAWGQKLD
jgi:antitoxin component YwqK of YwqJK toxin-antitoxin module